MNDQGLLKYAKLAATEMEVPKLLLKNLDYDTLPFYIMVNQLNFSNGLFTEYQTILIKFTSLFLFYFGEDGHNIPISKSLKMNSRSYLFPVTYCSSVCKSILLLSLTHTHTNISASFSTTSAPRYKKKRGILNWLVIRSHQMNILVLFIIAALLPKEPVARGIIKPTDFDFCRGFEKIAFKRNVFHFIHKVEKRLK